MGGTRGWHAEGREKEREAVRRESIAETEERRKGVGDAIE